MGKANEERERKAENLTWLRKHIKPGTRIYTVLRHVSSSGMSRDIDVYAIVPMTDSDGKRFHGPMWLSGRVASALGMRLSKDRGIKVGGCGMDMGFHLVMNLSYALHGHKPRGEGAKEENAGRPFAPRPGHYRSGYSLIHEWM